MSVVAFDSLERPFDVNPVEGRMHLFLIIGGTDEEDEGNRPEDAEVSELRQVARDLLVGVRRYP